MTSLREIRRRIQSVVNVQQITKAMEMVAAARLRKAQTKVERSRRYNQEMERIMGNLLASPLDIKHPLLRKRPVKKIAVVVISGDRGLCGSYHTTLFSKLDAFLKQLPQDQLELILIGKKAISAYARKGYNIKKRIPDWGGKISRSEVDTLTREWIDAFIKEEWDEIWIVYTHFINALSRTVMVDKWLPISVESEGKQPPPFIIESDPQEIYQRLLPQYFTSKIQMTLDDAYAAELAARTFSMRQANKNAKEMLETLILERNKIRQTGITREMIEITAGAQGV